MAGRTRAQRLLRALVEDPVLYLDEPDEEDRDYFLRQRARLERIAGELTGLQVERRREGTALVARGLVAQHADHWSWDPGDTASVTRATGKALAVLDDLRLAELGDDGVRVLPAAHRYRSAVARRPRPAQMEMEMEMA